MAVTKAGTFSKKAYCPNCFAVVTWDDPDDEVTVFGHRKVVCPECGKLVSIDKAEIVEAEAEAEDDGTH